MTGLNGSIFTSILLILSLQPCVAAVAPLLPPPSLIRLAHNTKSCRGR